MHAHLSIPVFHAHAPYIERKDLDLQVRKSFVAFLAALALTSAAVVGWTVLPQAASDTQARVIEWSTATPSISDWQYPRTTKSYDFMYAPGAETRNVDYMYAKPRSRSF